MVSGSVGIFIAFLIVLPFVFAYLSGTLPSGLIVAKLFKLGDLRSIGSGNIGATNVLRTGSKRAAVLTMLLDMLKGAIPVLIAKAMGMNEILVALTGIIAVLGHMYPVWLKFKGGKGVATSAGVLFALSPPVALLTIFCWVGVVYLTRISSLGALITTIHAPLYALVCFEARLAPVLAILTALIWWRHRANIKRLLNGTEPRFGSKS